MGKCADVVKLIKQCGERDINYVHDNQYWNCYHKRHHFMVYDGSEVTNEKDFRTIQINLWPVKVLISNELHTFGSFGECPECGKLFVHES